jgi:hypothetical protein
MMSISTVIREAVPCCAPEGVVLGEGVGVVGEGAGVVGEGAGVAVLVLVGVGLAVLVAVGLAVLVGLGEADFRAAFGFVAEAALDGAPADWFPPAADAGVDPAFADRALPRDFEALVDPAGAEVEAETCGCVAADGEP